MKAATKPQYLHSRVKKSWLWAAQRRHCLRLHSGQNGRRSRRSRRLLRSRRRSRKSTRSRMRSRSRKRRRREE
jgi:hypothetical protein